MFTEGSSIWNDKRADLSPADQTVDKFLTFNNNPKPGRMDAAAAAITYVSKWLYNEVVNENKSNTYLEIAQQISALQDAYELVDESFDKTDMSVLTENADWFIVTQERLKVDLTNYVFDGSLPEGDEYSGYIKKQGERILEAAEDRKEQGRRRVTD